MARFNVGDELKSTLGNNTACGKYNSQLQRDAGSYIKISGVVMLSGERSARYGYSILNGKGEIVDNCSSCFNCTNENQLEIRHNNHRENQEFKAGDRVKITSKAYREYGEEGTVIEERWDKHRITIQFDNEKGLKSYFKTDLRLVDKQPQPIKQTANHTKPTFMEGLVNKFKMITRSEPEKTFIKADVCDSNGVLNAEGQNLFLAYLLEKHGAEFKTDVVDIIIEDQKKIK